MSNTIALITDTHFGARQFSPIFNEYFLKFYDEVFFPTLKKRGIKKICHLGDFGDSRKFLNIHIQYTTRRMFLERALEEGYEMDVLVGNHDSYFKNRNDINGAREFLGLYPNIRIFEEAQDVLLNDLPVLYVPWINPSNSESTLNIISESNARVLMGHLEVNGFLMYKGKVAEHGLDRSVFSSFEKVFSGHFHCRSMDGNIEYLGAPYEMTAQDAGDSHGFHLFNTETLEKEFIENPYVIHHKVLYDDSSQDSLSELLSMDYSKFSNTFLKLIVINKKDPIKLEEIVSKIESVNPAGFTVVDTLDLEMNPEDGGDDMPEYSTLHVLDQCVEDVSTDLEKNRLKNLLRELYMDAVSRNEMAA